MRKRLEQLLSETFEYDRPKLVLKGEQTDLTCAAGGFLSSSFAVENDAKKKMKGFVYSTSPRLTPDAEEFSGAEITVSYRADARGLSAGDELEGALCLCTDIGELEVPVRIAIAAGKETKGAVKETRPQSWDRVLDGLVRRAKSDFSRGLEYFKSQEFEEALKKAPVSVRTLHAALTEKETSLRSLEEFLIGCGKKEPVELSLDKTEAVFKRPDATVLETVTVSRSTWGYLEFKVDSDARFLRPEKRSANTAQFAGSEYALRYIIDTNFLHAGKNFARLSVVTCYQTLTFEVTVDSRPSESWKSHKVRSLMKKKAMSLYIDYRLGRVDLHQWAERTRSVTASCRRAGGKEVWADLLDIFTLHADGKRARAQKLLTDLETNPQRLTDPSAYAAWLYLSTLFISDQDYVNQVRGRIRNLYLSNRDAWVIRWLQLYILSDEMGSEAGKLSAILDQIAHGASSPILYMEGALIARENPFLLHEWSSPVKQIIHFAVKNQLMTERLALQSASLVRRRLPSDDLSFRIMGLCWESTRLDDTLQALIMIAIAADKRQERYFPLYQAAVRSDLKVNRLYEYYLETMGEVRVEMLPQVIRKYLSYSDSLSWTRRAQIYRNIYEARENIPGVYRAMRSVIEKFAVDQLAMSRIDSNMAVLYEAFITKQMLTPSLARKLMRLLLTFEVECRSPLMKNAIAADIRLNEKGTCPITDSRALIRLYSEDSRILLEDADGNLYASTSLYMARHLLDAPNLMGMCAQTVTDDENLILFFTLNEDEGQSVTHSTLNMFTAAQSLTALSEDYRKKVRSWLLNYYSTHTGEETLRNYLSTADASAYDGEQSVQLMVLLAQEGFRDKAWELIGDNGPEKVPLSVLVRLCSQRVTESEYEEDAQLLKLCAYCFSAGKYEEHILIYLTMYYEGNVSRMKQLWNVARQYELDTMNLEKKILSLIIFTGSGTDNSEQIYRSYRRQMGSRRLCQAYVILRSYEYFVKGRPVMDTVFDDIAGDYGKGAHVPDICALALLQHLSTLIERSRQQDKMAEELLEKFSLRGMRFDFYLRFPRQMRSALGIEDKVFLECVADPQSKVTLYWRAKKRSVPFTKEAMRDVFEGIRVKEFVLFGDEALECYTETLTPSGEKVISPRRTLRAREVAGGWEMSRYGRISSMQKKLSAGDWAQFQEELKEYRQEEALARELFTLV